MSTTSTTLAQPGEATTFPRIISVDDHVVEPPGLWSERLPTSKRGRGPRVVREKGVLHITAEGNRVILEPEHPDARWADVWYYDDLVWAVVASFAYVGPTRDRRVSPHLPITYDEMLPGCYDPVARLTDMDANHTEVSVCFPTVPRFCGQTFLEREDKDFALECVRIYNDWMIDEWCGGQGRGRLIPLTLIPLWDPELAAAEVRRCAGKGSHAVCFPEAMHPLGLPTLYSGEWEQFLDACSETETVVNMHIGSSSTLPGTSPDAPLTVTIALIHENAAHALVDWVLSGALVRHPGVKIALSEAQAGWLPFILNRLDDIWHRGDMYEMDSRTDVRANLPELPSELVRHRVYTCIFNDIVGLRARDAIGMDHVMFETDYPHSDSTFPRSRQIGERLVHDAGLDEHETWRFVRGNAIECYGLGRWGITD